MVFANLSTRDNSYEERTLAPPEEISPLIRNLFWASFLIFLVAVSVVALLQPLQIWDEIRSLINASELPGSKSWMVTTYNGLPDHWYTKPPFYVWLVTLFLRLGVDPVAALRFPSIAAGMLSVLALYFYSSRLLRRPVTGVIAALLLMCSTLFFGPHIVLTGDLDAMLSFLLTACALAFWAYVERQGSDSGWLAVSCIALSLALLTKGIAGALFLPGLFVFTLLRPQRWRVLTDWKLWTGLLLVVSVIFSYYYFRNILDPGYAHAVLVNEFGRFNVVVEGHQGGPAFYPILLIKGFEPGFLLVLIGCFSFARFAAQDSLARSAKMLCAIVPGLFLLTLTKSQTKINWYVAPAIPLLSLFAAVGFVDTCSLLSQRFGSNSRRLWMDLSRMWTPALLMVVALAAVIVRAQHVEAHVRASDSVLWSGELTTLIEQRPEVHSIVLLQKGHSDITSGHDDYYPVGQYWAATFAKAHNITVELAGDASEIAGGKWIVSCDPDLFKTPELEKRIATAVDKSSRCVVEQTTK